MSGTDEGGKPASSGSPFWNFSLSIYRSPQVQAACLGLQDGAGVDVNVLLYMLWLASQGRQVPLEEARRIVETVEAWRQEVVVALRTARRALKEPPREFDAQQTATLREQVKRMELEAERLQQEALYGLSSRILAAAGTGVRAAAEANVTAYAKVLGRAFPPEHVDTMIEATAAKV